MGRPIMPQTLQVLAVAAALWSAAATIAGPAWAQEPRMVPVTVDGQHVLPDRWSPLVESYLKRRGLPTEKP